MSQQTGTQPNKPPNIFRTITTVDATPAQRRPKKRKANEQPNNDKVNGLIPDSKIFSSLIQYEHYTDNLLRRKRLAANELSASPHMVPQKLRIYIYNTHSHQNVQSSGVFGGMGQRTQTDEGDKPDPTKDPPSWTLHVYGRILDVNPPTQTATPPQTPPDDTLPPPTTQAPEDPPSELIAQESKDGGDDKGVGKAAKESTSASLKWWESRKSKYLLPQQQVNLVGNIHNIMVPKYAFSAYIKELRVQLDPDQYPGKEGDVHWDKSNHVGTHKESFEIKRPGSKPVRVKISLHVDWACQRHVLSKGLQALLGVECSTQAKLLSSMWAYVKAKGLQNLESPDKILCDPPLQRLFGCKSLQVSQLCSKLQSLVTPINEVTIDYLVRTAGPSPTHPDLYDIDLDVPIKVNYDKFPLDIKSTTSEITQLNETINCCIKKFQERRRRRAFYNGFSIGPVEFIRGLIESQAKDLRESAGSNVDKREYSANPSAALFKQPWVEQAVVRYLHQKKSTGK